MPSCYTAAWGWGVPVRVSERTKRRIPARRGRKPIFRVPVDPNASLAAPPSGELTAALSIPAKASAASPVPYRKPPKGSKLRKTAMQIIAMRMHGFSDDEIAPAVGLKNAQSVKTYVWRASKQGWLTGEIDSPKDKLDYDVMHKVVRNMEQALDSADDERRDRMAVKIAEGTLFKQYDAEAAQNRPPLTQLAVMVVMPEGNAPTIREGAAVGVGNVMDAEILR